MLNFNFFCLETKEPKIQGFGCLGEKDRSPWLKIPKLAIAQTVGIFYARSYVTYSSCVPSLDYLSHASNATTER